VAPITTIVHFEVPADNLETFLSFWKEHIKEEVSKQPGLVDGIFHRRIDRDGQFQFVNVAHWESAEDLAAGLRTASEELPEINEVFRRLRVKVSQNNYVEAVRYASTKRSPTE
jgi:hypothetical protein